MGNRSVGYLIVFLGGGIGAALRLQPCVRAFGGDCISVCDPVRKCVGLDRDGNAGGDFCLPKWNSAPLATLPHHRNSRGLYEVLDVFARCCMSAARSVWRRFTYCISRIVDRRAVRWARAGPQLRLSALVHRSQAELVEQRHVSVSPGIWRRQKFRPVEDRIGASQETKCLRFFAHVFPACG